MTSHCWLHKSLPCSVPNIKSHLTASRDIHSKVLVLDTRCWSVCSIVFRAEVLVDDSCFSNCGISNNKYFKLRNFTLLLFIIIILWSSIITAHLYFLLFNLKGIMYLKYKHILCAVTFSTFNQRFDVLVHFSAA